MAGVCTLNTRPNIIFVGVIYEENPTPRSSGPEGCQRIVGENEKAENQMLSKESAS